ncbi:MAG TPA: hypothetical protein VH370_16930 [Humisphaera sp.]|nr:hypothetical protein [Humisphaera sp.]
MHRIAGLALYIVGIAVLAIPVSFAIAQEPPRFVKIQIDPAAVIGKVPDDFVGFGYETSAVAQPSFFAAKNAQMIRLYGNLGRQGLIRIGGNVSDHTRFVANGTAAAKTEREVTIINQTSLTDLADFSRATGWKVMWGLNLGTGSKEEAVEEAIAVDAALGTQLHSFEIGNEVDLMRKFSKDFDAYHAAYLEYKAAIRARLPRAAFSGPDSASSLPFVEKFVAAESADMRLATHHYYRTSARNADATIEHLLARDEAFDARLIALHKLTADRHLDYRINEVNSFFGGGKDGVSNTYASALWCLDYMFNLAAHGCSGVNMETDINQLGFISHYSPIIHDANGDCSARPEYYGMLVFAMAGHGQLIKATIEKTNLNLTAYATKATDGAIFVTVINKDLTRDAAIELAMPAGVNRIEAHRLTAPSIEAKDGVRFANAVVAENGSWNSGLAEVIAFSADSANPIVPHASAIVLKLSK